MSDTPPGDGRPMVEGYDDLAQIGRGGFATVYRARQVRFDRVVALKVLDVATPDEAARDRFDRECRAIGALSWHPNIVVVHDSGLTTDGRLFLAMEFLEAGSLAERVGRDGAMAWADVARVGVEVAAALETAHEAGTLHRDLKPDNVLVGVFGEAKLGDFGIAAVEGGPATATGNSALTVLYAAPEVLRGERATVASDVYSLASTLYTLLAGHAAFSRGTDESVAATVLRAVAEPAPDLRPRGVPDDLAGVLEAAMAKAPGDRPPTAADLGRLLQGVQRAHGLEVTPLRLDPRRARAAAVASGDPGDTIRTGDLPPVPGAGVVTGGRGDSAPTVVPAASDAPPEARTGRALLVAGVVALALLVGAGAWYAFGRTDGDEAARSGASLVERATTTTTTTSTTQATTTSAAPTTAPPPPTSPSVTAVSPFASTTPEQAAEGLLVAWTVGDRVAAGQFAEQGVVDELFVRPTGGAGSTFEGCTDNGDGTFACALRFEGGATIFTVRAPPGGRFRVVAANSIAD